MPVWGVGRVASERSPLTQKSESRGHPAAATWRRSSTPSGGQVARVCVQGSTVRSRGKGRPLSGVEAL
jgi:hypothetical protein